jgi:parallel beta-helix repeat protein
MKRHVALLGIMLTLLFMGILSLTFKIQPVKAEPTTWIVNDDGPADFSSIQEAINAASLGDIIYVYNGTYCENVIVNKTISLFGESQETTFIKGDGNGTVVDVVANDVKIFGFTIQDGYYGILLNVSSGIVIETNTITNNFFGVYARYSSNNSLSADRIIGNYYSIYLWYSEESNIVSNTLINNTHGMDMWFSSTIDIHDNFIVDNEHYGIYLYRSDSNFISENVFENNHEDPFGFDGYAVWLDRSNGNKVDSNIVFKNTDGVFIYDSKDNIVRGNTIATNQKRGVMLGGYLLSEHYYNNTICGNTIWSNKIGIDLYQYANYNRIYHNNFIDNEIQANVDEFTSDNIWDNGYPFGGNYWSDHNPPDGYSGPYQNETGRDKIGDMPYSIDGNNTDRYPLIYPYGRVPSSDLNGDGTVNIIDVILLANSFGSSRYPEHPNWNPDADLNSDSIINIFDAILIAGDFGKTS